MKNFLAIRTLSATIAAVVLLGSCSADKVVTQGPFQKRKYRKGFHIDLASKNKSQKKVDIVENVSEEKPIEQAEARSYTTVYSSNDEATIAGETKTENVSIPQISDKSTLAVGEDNKGQKVLNEAEKFVQGVKTVQQKLEPQDANANSEIDPLLKKAIIFAALAVVISIFSSIAGWFIGLWIFNFIFWMAAAACWIVAVFYFVKWLLEQDI